MAKDYLFEIGTEEMPAHVVPRSVKQLADRTRKFLKENGLKFKDIKTFATPRRLTILVEDLAEADEVYIFGHSLGTNDHDYFYDFFQDCIHYHKENNCKRKIRIFTYDVNSELEIKKQLMKLTNKHLIGLYAHCDVKILKTCREYQDSWMLKDDF